MFEYYVIELARNGNTRLIGAFSHLQYAMLLHERLNNWRTVVVDQHTLNLFQMQPESAAMLYQDRWRDWQRQQDEEILTEGTSV